MSDSRYMRIGGSARPKAPPTIRADTCGSYGRALKLPWSAGEASAGLDAAASVSHERGLRL